MINDPEKIFYSISEVADMLGVKQSLLRHWEKELSYINPPRSAKNTRQYKKEDIEKLRQVHYLVKEKRMTLEGAQKKIRENKGQVIQIEAIVHHLKNIKSELMSLKVEFDEMEKEYSLYENSNN
jgi:DNA-binding transcriptional MerR regulator